MDATKVIAVRRVKLSEDLTAPGDWCLIAKREPKVTTELMPILPPAGFWARLRWALFGAKYTVKETIEEVWPNADTVIVNCPTCNSPCGTTSRHTIVSVDPLTIELPITCPYCRTTTFEVKDGKLTIA